MNKLIILSAVALSIAFISFTEGYGTGAPELACNDLIPQHHTDPQKTRIPYKLRGDKQEIGKNDQVKLILEPDQALNGKPFKGFLIVAKNNAGSPVGTFKSTSRDIKIIGCKEDASSSGATHSSSDVKNRIELIWTPQHQSRDAIKGPITFFTTVAENGGVFWTNQPLAKVNVK